MFNYHEVIRAISEKRGELVKQIQNSPDSKERVKLEERLKGYDACAEIILNQYRKAKGFQAVAGRYSLAQETYGS